MTLNLLKTTVAVIALTAGASFADTTTGSTDDSTQEIIKNTTDEAAQATENVAEDTAEAAGDAADAVEDTAENAAEATEDAMENTAEAVDNAVEETGDAMQTDTAETEMEQSDDNATSTNMAVASPFDGMVVGDLIGLNVYGANGEDVGEVDYIVREGDALAAVIGIGGFLGLGEYTVSIPLDEFVPAEGDLEGIQLNNWTEEELKALPEFDESTVEPLADDTPVTDV